MRTYNWPANETVCAGFIVEPLIVRDTDEWRDGNVSLGLYPMKFRPESSKDDVASISDPTFLSAFSAIQDNKAFLRLSITWFTT